MSKRYLEAGKGTVIYRSLNTHPTVERNEHVLLSFIKGKTLLLKILKLLYVYSRNVRSVLFGLENGSRPGTRGFCLQ